MDQVCRSRARMLSLKIGENTGKQTGTLKEQGKEFDCAHFAQNGPVHYRWLFLVNDADIVQEVVFRILK